MGKTQTQRPAARRTAGRATDGQTHAAPRSNGQARKGAFTDNHPDSPIVKALRVQVANGMTLFMNYKHYHWQVFGPHFRDLHKMFDEFAAEVLESVDELAERVRMIGQNPPFDPAEMQELATVSVAARIRGEHKPNLREMIAEADANLLTVITEMREAAGAADDSDDPGTNDLYSRIVQIHEKHEWYLRDILERGDGLS